MGVASHWHYHSKPAPKGRDIASKSKTLLSIQNTFLKIPNDYFSQISQAID